MERSPLKYRLASLGGMVWRTNCGSGHNGSRLKCRDERSLAAKGRANLFYRLRGGIKDSIDFRQPNKRGRPFKQRPGVCPLGAWKTRRISENVQRQRRAPDSPRPARSVVPPAVLKQLPGSPTFAPSLAPRVSSANSMPALVTPLASVSPTLAPSLPRKWRQKNRPRQT